MPLRHLTDMKLATNNLWHVREDTKGARCVYCLGHPNVSLNLKIVIATLAQSWF